MRGRCRRLAGLTLGALALGSCGDARSPLVTVTDSAGVRITLSQPGPQTFAVVDSAPTMSLGGPDAEGATQFSRIQGVHLDPMGRVWVADGQSAQLRIFLADGKPWKTLGGKGGGPGEFQQIRLLGPFRGDSVAVADDAQGRLTVFDPEGELSRTARFTVGDVPVPRTHDVFRDGSVLGQTPRLLVASSLEANQILVDTARLVRVDFDDGELTDLAEAPGPLWLWTGRNQVPLPFTANPGLDLDGESLHLVAGSEFRVRVFEAALLSEIYGVSREPQAVRDSDVEGYRAMTEEYLPERVQADYLAALDHPARPDVLPAYSRLVVATDRNVWVQRSAPDAVWEVFGQDRAWLGRVDMPTGFIPTHVTATRLAGVWRDDLHVEHVRVYRLRRGPT